MINPSRRQSLVLFCALMLYGAAAQAFSTGITTGSFGASGCNQCHSGGTPPTTTLSGPTAVGSGTTNTYTLTVTNPGSQTHAGLNVSTTAGTLAIGGPSSAQTQVLSGQITHTSRKINAAGVTTFSFDWTAPVSFSSVNMRGWGNAVDFSFDNSGDRADLDELTITNSDPPTPTPTATPSPTIPPPLCAATPLSCTTPGKSSLTYTNQTDDGKDTVAFKWMKGPTTDINDFGSPTTTTSYALCIYQNGILHLEVTAPAAGTCGTKPCWAQKTKGFSYKDKLATPNGLTAMTLSRADDPGKAKIQVKSKGLLLADPGSIPMAVSVTAQVVNDESSNCWGDTWTPAEISNDGVKLKAKSSD